MSEPVTDFPVGRGDRGKRLDHFLHEKIPGLSRTRIQSAIRSRVTLSWGVKPRPATPVRPGGTVHVGYTPLPETLLPIRLTVLARGRGWLAVDKPPTIPVHPVNRIRENSLIRILRRQEGRDGLRLAHRLDRETSGVLLIAEDADSARQLARGFVDGSHDKQYLALVRGQPSADRGCIDLPVGPDPASPVFVKCAVNHDHGKPARTLWSVERRCGDRALLRLTLDSGRRHQLRVHLAALGHPVLGDLLYGRPDGDYLRMVAGDDPRRESGGPVRQLLHCERIAFDAPFAAGRTTVVAPLPADFRAALEPG